MVSSPTTRASRSLWTSTVAAAVFASSLLVTGASATSALGASKGDVGPVEVSAAVHSDVSGPLSSLVGVAASASTDKQKHEKPLNAQGVTPRGAHPAEIAVPGPLYAAELRRRGFSLTETATP